MVEGGGSLFAASGLQVEIERRRSFILSFLTRHGSLYVQSSLLDIGLCNVASSLVDRMDISRERAFHFSPSGAVCPYFSNSLVFFTRYAVLFLLPRFVYVRL